MPLPSAASWYCTKLIAPPGVNIGPHISRSVGGLITCTCPKRRLALWPRSRNQRPPGQGSITSGNDVPSGSSADRPSSSNTASNTISGGAAIVTSCEMVMVGIARLPVIIDMLESPIQQCMLPDADAPVSQVDFHARARPFARARLKRAQGVLCGSFKYRSVSRIIFHRRCSQRSALGRSMSISPTCRMGSSRAASFSFTHDGDPPRSCSPAVAPGAGISTQIRIMVLSLHQ